MRRRRKPAVRDYYADLGVKPDAAADDIKRAYRALALKYHPDKVAASKQAAATERLAIINTAWDVVGDAERRLAYDTQREADGTHGSTQSIAARLRRSVLGSAGCRSLPWTSGVPYVSPRATRGMDGALRAGKPVLLFVHLGGSPRAARNAPAIVEAHRRLGALGAAYVAAVDAAAEPAFAAQFHSADGELPAAVLVTADGRGGASARAFPPPLNSSEIIAATSAALPELNSVCTARQWRGLAAAAAGPPRKVAVALAMRPAMRAATRAACAGLRSILLCGSVAHQRCDLPPEAMACPGVALLASAATTVVSGSGSAASGGGGGGGGGSATTYLRLLHCVTDEDDVAARLRSHATRVRLGPAAGPLAIALRSAGGSRPARAAAAFGGAVASAPPVRSVAAATVEFVAANVAPLMMGGVGVLGWVAVKASGKGRGEWWSQGRGRTVGRRRSRGRRARAR